MSRSAKQGSASAAFIYSTYRFAPLLPIPCLYPVLQPQLAWHGRALIITMAGGGGGSRVEDLTGQPRVRQACILGVKPRFDALCIIN